MLKLYVLGTTQVTLLGRKLDLPRKGLALMVYLALEQVSITREQAAALLWEHSEARQNLRVELARMRAAGLDVFAAASQILSLEKAETDFELWLNQSSRLRSQTAALEWLAQLRGTLLSGLEDLGSREFRQWLEHVRMRLTDRIETALLELVVQAQREDWGRALEIAHFKAEEFGFELPPSPVLGSGYSASLDPDLHVSRPLEERKLLEALEKSRQHPMLVLLRGEAGSGKTYLANWLMRRAEGLVLRVNTSRSSRLLLASLVSQIMPHLRGSARETALALQSNPGELELDMVKLTALLERIPQPISFLLEHTQVAPPELATQLEFWMGNLRRGLFLMLCREGVHRCDVVRSLQSRVASEYQLQLVLSSPSLESVCSVLERREGKNEGDALLAYANQILQRSDGNMQHLMTLLSDTALGAYDTHLPAPVLDLYLGEARGWPLNLFNAMRYLSVVHLPLDEELVARVLLPLNFQNPNQLLSEALERGILVVLPPERALVFPYWTSMYEPHPLEERFVFRSESLRIALASSLPQPTRQEVRRQMVGLLAQRLPGLACYYAQRTGLEEEAQHFTDSYHHLLPPGSPLRESIPPGQSWVQTIRAPQPLRSSAVLPLFREQGYHFSLEGGWLSVRRRGHYGHPQTLQLLFALPILPRTGTLRIVWRLDGYNGGQELLPPRVPFALRLRLSGDLRATVLSPENWGTYPEDEVIHHTQSNLRFDGWMEHQLELELPPDGALLEVSVRALDVALIIGTLEWAGQDIFHSSHNAVVSGNSVAVGREPWE